MTIGLSDAEDFDLSIFEESAAATAGVDAEELHAEVTSADVQVSLAFDEAATSDDVAQAVALTSEVNVDDVTVRDSSSRRLERERRLGMLTWSIVIRTTSLLQAAAVQRSAADGAALNASLHVVRPGTWAVPSVVAAPTVEVQVTVFARGEAAATLANKEASLEAIFASALGMPVSIVQARWNPTTTRLPFEDAQGLSAGTTIAVAAVCTVVGIVIGVSAGMVFAMRRAAGGDRQAPVWDCAQTSSSDAVPLDDGGISLPGATILGPIRRFFAGTTPRSPAPSAPQSPRSPRVQSPRTARV